MTPLSPALSRTAVDRAAPRRGDQEWLDAAAVDPSSRVMLVEDGRTLVTTDPPAIAWYAADDPSLPGESERERYFLGEDERSGVAYFAVPTGIPLTGDATAQNLREVGEVLGAADAGLMVNAVALDNWHRTHPRCPRCGEPTTMVQGGQARRCDNDGSTHFPRTDPAVIMLVHDGADRCLLGRQPSWPERRFSCLAGFVEAGESAEAAVVREVAEEVGVRITAVEYRASQPWPFPCSLMLGFRALAADGPVVLADGEIAEARWRTRGQLREALSSGEVLLPPPVSIAYQLITEWLDETPGVP